MSIHYRIIKCELDEEGSLLSLGPIPGKLLSIQQANLRVSTLMMTFIILSRLFIQKIDSIKIVISFNLNFINLYMV